MSIEERCAMIRELSRLLACLVAESGEENPPPELFTNVDVPALRGSETMEVKVRRKHKPAYPYPSFDLAGVIGFEK